MGRKRRRRLHKPPLPDPFEEMMRDLLGEVKQTFVQGVRQILTPPQFPTYQPPPSAPPDQPVPRIKQAEVISVRDST